MSASASVVATPTPTCACLGFGPAPIGGRRPTTTTSIIRHHKKHEVLIRYNHGPTRIYEFNDFSSDGGRSPSIARDVLPALLSSLLKENESSLPSSSTLSTPSASSWTFIASSDGSSSSNGSSGSGNNSTSNSTGDGRITTRRHNPSSCRASLHVVGFGTYELVETTTTSDDGDFDAAEDEKDDALKPCSVVAVPAPTTTSSSQHHTHRYYHYTYHPLTINLNVPLLGGKGGFGTLLKGQSKQAGAKTTYDFGACRDLSGRRLRHVNDEIKLRKWRSAQRRRERGEAVDEVAELKTDSGIRNWHLLVPSWSDAGSAMLSNKGRRKADVALQREVNRWQSVEARAKERMRRKKDEEERAVASYVHRATVEGEKVGSTMKDSVAEGMKKRREAAKAMAKAKKDKPTAKEADVGAEAMGETTTATATATAAATLDGKEAAARDAAAAAREAAAAANDEGEDEGDDAATASPSYLCTLSGEIVVPDDDGNDDGNAKGSRKRGTGQGKIAKSSSSSSGVQIQSHSDFATCALLPRLMRTRTRIRRCGGGNNGSSSAAAVRPRPTYLEVTIQTGGLAQIGWVLSPITGEGGAAAAAAAGFSPNSDTGDGVGDDDMSFGYDGSRGLIFHGDGDGDGDGSVQQTDRPYPAPSSGGENDRTRKCHWEPNDVVGMLYHPTVGGGTMSYTLNGMELGVAFSNVHGTGSSGDGDGEDGGKDGNNSGYCYPAFSLNHGEILGINAGPTFVHGPPEGYEPACTWIGSGGGDDDDDDDDEEEEDNDVDDDEQELMGKGGESATAAIIVDNGGGKDAKAAGDDDDGAPVATKTKQDHSAETGGGTKEEERATASSKAPPPAKRRRGEEKEAEAATTTGPINLDDYNSASELEALGMDRLKTALMALGVKCGGSLQERANRLFSLKGLRRDEYPKKVRGKNFVV